MVRKTGIDLEDVNTAFIKQLHTIVDVLGYENFTHVLACNRGQINLYRSLLKALPAKKLSVISKAILTKNLFI